MRERGGRLRNNRSGTRGFVREDHLGGTADEALAPSALISFSRQDICANIIETAVDPGLSDASDRYMAAQRVRRFCQVLNLSSKTR